MKVYRELEEYLHSFRTSLPEAAGWLALGPGIFNNGNRPPAPTEDVAACIPKPV